MKTIISLLFVFTAFNLFGAQLDEQVDAPKIERTISLWQMLIPVVVPFLIGVVKHFIPKLPKDISLLLAPFLGALIDVILNYFDLGGGYGAVGGTLGLAGVGVYEFKKRTVKRIRGEA